MRISAIIASTFVAAAFISLIVLMFDDLANSKTNDRSDGYILRIDAVLIAAMSVMVVSTASTAPLVFINV